MSAHDLGRAAPGPLVPGESTCAPGVNGGVSSAQGRPAPGQDQWKDGYKAGVRVGYRIALDLVRALNGHVLTESADSVPFSRAGSQGPAPSVDAAREPPVPCGAPFRDLRCSRPEGHKGYHGVESGSCS